MKRLGHGFTVLSAVVGLAAHAEPSTVRIDQTNGGYQLLRNGQPFFIRGAVGAMRPELLVASGGNSIRAGARQLDLAAKLGLTVLVGLPLGNPRHGFDYADADQVRRQFDRARELVLRHKDHPALLLWAIGNEPEIQTTPEQRLPVWRAVNELATMVKELDGRHPVITVIGGQYRQMLHEVSEHCPALDAIGLNSYADMLTLPEDVAREGWSRPYLVTEFGPRGHWQVPKTPWRVPIEDSSTAKAEFYLKAYRHAVADRPQCLGSYVFYWNQKQEKTHTWYGLFLPDGSRTAAIDTMQFAWTGQWPTNRCPSLEGAIRLDAAGGAEDGGGRVLTPGARVGARIRATDPEGDPLRITWDLRKDVADNPNVGGDYEPATPPIEGAIESTQDAGAVARVQLPDAPGNYRLFVYVHDGQGGAATANVPIRVR